VYDESINIRYQRKGIKEKYVDEVDNLSTQYNFPFCCLKWRQRIDRIDDITKRILAMWCVDLSGLGIGGSDYYNGNLKLSHDVLNIVHGIKERLELELNFQINVILKVKKT
jgi:hypothetical protein